MVYHKNVCTMATDGPSIIHIGKPELAISKSRLYVENMLYAMPSYSHMEEPNVRYYIKTQNSVETLLLRL